MTSVVSFVSGAMVVAVLGRLPQESQILSLYMHFWRSYHRRQWDFGTSGEPFRHAEAELELRTLAGGCGSFSKLFVKFFVLVVCAGEPAFDEEIADFRLHFERVPVCYDQICQFSLFDGP